MRGAEQHLIEALLSCDTPEKVKSFLRDMLTPTEYEALVKRWKVLELLVEGHSQREIAASLGMSLCKITRGSKILKSKRSPVARILKVEQ